MTEEIKKICNDLLKSHEQFYKLDAFDFIYHDLKHMGLHGQELWEATRYITTQLGLE